MYSKQQTDMDFGSFMEAAGYSPDTRRCYSYYARMIPADLDQTNLDAMILARRHPAFRSFLRTYIYEFLKRHDLHVSRRRGHPRRVAVRYLSRQELELLLASDLDPRVRMFVRLVMETGLRISEVLRVNKYILMFGRVTGKGNVESDLIVSRGLMEEFLKACDSRGTVFNVKRNTLYKMVRAAGEKFLEKKISPHDFRRTYGVKRRGEGCDIYRLSKELRHGDIGTTQRYFDVPEKEMAEKGWSA